MMANNLNLSTLFQSVTERLAENKTELNQADTYNHDHGDHMVEIFNLVQKAVTEKSKAPVPEQLRYASQVVEKESKNGSAKLYSKGLANAATQFTGNDLTADNIGNLVKSLLGAEDKQVPQSNNQLGSMLSGLTGQKQETQAESGFGVDDLLKAGMAFMHSKKSGASTTDAVLQAVITASPLGQSAHRSQSGKLVASTLMNAAQSFMKN